MKHLLKSLVIGLVLWSTLLPLRATTNQSFVRFDKAPVHSTRLLARFDANRTEASRSNILAALNERAVRAYSLVPGLVVLEPAQVSAMSAPAATPSKRSPANELRRRMKALQATRAFGYVQPDYELTALVTPNDARFTDGTLWGLKNLGYNGGIVGADIDAESAWDITTGSPSVIVAVIDSGIRYTHQELASRMWLNPGEVAGNGIDDDGDGYVDNVYGINAITGSGNPMDDNDHGTHCAGTIGAAANDGNPLVGVAWNVRLMACKFLDASGSGSTSDAIECIDFAVANGAKVLNNSWGGGPFQQALQDAIVGARDSGVLFVAAAGNGGFDGIGDNNDNTPSYPASYAVENVLSVAAVNSADQLASFSNFGQNSVHLGAPGVSIYSSTTGADNEYQYLSGTSMATPHVSGVAALIYSHFPGITSGEVKQRILAGTVPIPALNGKTVTGARLNALNALSVSGDGVLEVSVSSSEGVSLPAGSTVSVFARVTDLTNIVNATVTGSVIGQGNLTFANNGVAPDQVSGDATYSANLVVPSIGNSLSLTVVATAPGKVAVTNTTVFTIRQAPPNDSFANAFTIAPAGGTVTGTNIDSSSQSGEPVACDLGGGRTVWWRWTAPKNEIVTLSTLGSDFDTVLAVYTGAAVNALAPVICNDDVPGGFFTSEVIFQAVAGTTYRIAVDGYAGDQGFVSLTLTETVPATNDNFANRAPVTGINRTVHASNFGATVELSEPYHCGGDGGASLWWTWTAPGNLPVSISTLGSSLDTVLAVYVGSSYGTLSAITCNDDRIPDAYPDGVTSEVTFNAVGGTTYQIAVAGYNDGFSVEQGNIALNIVTVPANDLFANRTPLTGAVAFTNGFNIRATAEAGEPYHNFYGGRQSVWWTWTAPASGNASVTTHGSNFDTVLAVYTGNAVNSLSLIADNDDEVTPIIRTSKVTFNAIAGMAYQIAVDGFLYTDFLGDPTGTDAGLISLALSLNGKSRLDDFHLRSDGHYEFLLRGDSGRNYRIETTSAPGQPWTVLGEVYLNSPSALFIDPEPAGVTSRFYRAVLATLVQH